MAEGGQRADNDFSGDAASVVQAGTVQGGIHLHGPSRTVVSVPPHQLPGGTAVFINRESVLAQLNELLATWAAEGDAAGVPTATVCALAGSPGVGKTALALHWAHRVRRNFPDGDLEPDPL